MTLFGATVPRLAVVLVPLLVLVVVVVTVTVYDHVARPQSVVVRILDGPKVISTQVVPLRP